MAKKKKKTTKAKAGKKKVAAKKKTTKAKGKKKSRKLSGAKKTKAKKKPATKKKAVKKTVRKKVVKAKKKVTKKVVAKKPGVKKMIKKTPVQKKVVHKPIEKIEAQSESSVQQQAASHSEHRESFTPHVTGLKAGDPAPHFTGVDQGGNRITSDDFHGKTLVLYFYPKDDTDGCTAESCSLRDEYQYITMQNHAVVGVSADDVESHKHFADKFSLPFPLIADTNMDMIRAYDVWGQKRLFDHIYDGIVRTTFIIKDGIITRVITAVNTKEHGKQVMEA